MDQGKLNIEDVFWLHFFGSLIIRRDIFAEHVNKLTKPRRRVSRVNFE